VVLVAHRAGRRWARRDRARDPCVPRACGPPSTLPAPAPDAGSRSTSSDSRRGRRSSSGSTRSRFAPRRRSRRRGGTAMRGTPRPRRGSRPTSPRRPTRASLRRSARLAPTSTSASTTPSPTATPAQPAWRSTTSSRPPGCGSRDPPGTCREPTSSRSSSAVSGGASRREPGAIVELHVDGGPSSIPRWTRPSGSSCSKPTTPTR
jgi:hypothetical protein